MRVLSALRPALISLLITIAPHAQGQSTSPSTADAAVGNLQSKWAEIKYGMVDKKQQLVAINALEAEAADVVAQNPRSAGPLIWQAIILSTEAGIDGGVSALGKVKQAKEILENAERIDPAALDGSVYTSLGSLYYQVPGWPIGFGDDKKALEYLNKALAMNPSGIDPNYFYGDYLLNKGKYKDAIAALEKALQAPPRPNRESADAGRRQEIQVALAKARKKAGIK